MADWRKSYLEWKVEFVEWQAKSAACAAEDEECATAPKWRLEGELLGIGSGDYPAAVTQLQKNNKN